MAALAKTRQELEEQVLHQITSSMTAWKAFLATVGRMYKYPYTDQLMIHAQRPLAEACAQMELWNRCFHRRVKRGAKGIALFFQDGRWQKIKYVFDLNDTYKQDDAAPPVLLWTLEETGEQVVCQVLKDLYNRTETGFLTLITAIATQQLGNIADKNKLLCNEQAPESHLQKFIIDSTCYTIFSRCQKETPISLSEYETLLPIFSTQNSILRIAEAVSHCTANLLRAIESAIKAPQPVKPAPASPVKLHIVENSEAPQPEAQTHVQIPEAQAEAPQLPPAQATVPALPPPATPSENFTLTVKSYPSGAKSRSQRTVNALTLLKQLNIENRQATREEQETLAGYAGGADFPKSLRRII